MNIILFTKGKGCSGLVALSKRRFVTVFVSLFIILPITTISVGYYLGVNQMRLHPDDIALVMEAERDEQKLKIELATRSAEENMNALAIRLGKLQAHVIRLDALGQRLTKMAKLDNGEFDFDSSPARGGPASTIKGQVIDVPDFIKALANLSSQLDHRGNQLGILETMMMNKNLQSEVMPAGRPVTRGWLSSYFGIRTDPFTGRRVHHSGVDFAGKEGSNVIAVAAGVVVYAGRKSGYGNLVEINHGNGYYTRYGHNKKILVKVGDTVKKNTVLSLMGSTGRSTGPHVHFEVLKNGRAVNPKKYVHRTH
ncbi:MAG: M23 family metallopeptidase [Gammaproteobacteria bacterium]